MRRLSLVIVSFAFILKTCYACTNVQYSQCGGTGWTGETCCPVGTYCYVASPSFHQCIPGTPPTPLPTVSPTKSPTNSPTPQPTPCPNGPNSKCGNGFPECCPYGYWCEPSGNGGRCKPGLPPTLEPTVAPTKNPTPGPTPSPTMSPIVPGQPTAAPTDPTAFPTISPSVSPTLSPTLSPTPCPNVAGDKCGGGFPLCCPDGYYCGPQGGQDRCIIGSAPTFQPTPAPSTSPTTSPSPNPTQSPSPAPTTSPSASPTRFPKLPLFTRDFGNDNYRCDGVDIITQNNGFNNIGDLESCAEQCYQEIPLCLYFAWDNGDTPSCYTCINTTNVPGDLVIESGTEFYSLQPTASPSASPTFPGNTNYPTISPTPSPIYLGEFVPVAADKKCKPEYIITDSEISLTDCAEQCFFISVCFYFTYVDYVIGSSNCFICNDQVNHFDFNTLVDEPNATLYKKNVPTVQPTKSPTFPPNVPTTPQPTSSQQLALDKFQAVALNYRCNDFKVLYSGNGDGPYATSNACAQVCVDTFPTCEYFSYQAGNTPSCYTCDFTTDHNDINTLFPLQGSELYQITLSTPQPTGAPTKEVLRGGPAPGNTTGEPCVYHEDCFNDGRCFRERCICNFPFYGSYCTLAKDPCGIVPEE